MRIKTIAIRRAKRSKKAAPPPPSNSPIHQHLAEATKGYHLDGEHHESSSHTDSGQENDGVDHDAGNGNYNVEDANLGSVGVDSHVKKHHSSGPSKGGVDTDYLGGNFCILCKRGGNQLLHCSEYGCPIGLHEVCMETRPTFDEMGHFYCPCCWYRRALLKTEQLRRKVMLAKRDLLNFIGSKLASENGEKQKDSRGKENGQNRSTNAGKRNCCDSENGLHDHVESMKKEKTDKVNSLKAPRYENFGNIDRKEEDNGYSEHHKIIEHQQPKDSSPTHYL
ncbi:hypothetical protein SLA2020_151620 [Shorea laevis]